MDIFLLVAFLAGLLTVLAPCILPLLPVVIGASESGARGISLRAVTVIGALSFSVIVFTFLLKASTLLIAIPQVWWTWFSGAVIILVGVAMVFPDLWARVPFIAHMSRASNKALGAGYQKKNVAGDAAIGIALGPVFTTCSPTYLFIIATVLPATFGTGALYLLSFTLGLALSLLAVAYFGQQLVSVFVGRERQTGTLKKAFGVLIVLVGLAIFTGYDKKIETWILDAGYGATINFEQRLIEQFAPSLPKDSPSGTEGVEIEGSSVAIPPYLSAAFPATDFSHIDPRLEGVVSGGPGKDGIPAIDAPRFVPLDSFTRSDEILAVVLPDGDRVKVYPYNILTWHEIVNDVVNGEPVAVTFCPLCGSAVVYERTLPKGITTFGVSGSLLESNMIMYDRATESLWQQSTGQALAGAYFGRELSLVPFQLLTLGEIRATHKDALVLSEQTGHVRDYARNPYAGYEESDSFIFAPSRTDVRYPAKEIIVVFRAGEVSIATPWLTLNEYSVRVGTVNGNEIRVEKRDGELSIMVNGVDAPFYFEMWFSWVAQHGTEGEVFDPSPVS